MYTYKQHHVLGYTIDYARVSSHFVNSHFVNIDQMGIDKVGIDEVEINRAATALRTYVSVYNFL